jgi:predicted flavoprotein YhiN
MVEITSSDNQLGNISDISIVRAADAINGWRIRPAGTEGYRTAEVTLGGVNTAEISSKDMQVRSCSGLYFIGEVLDVTGQLGGHNFQWAWSSAYAAAKSF